MLIVDDDAATCAFLHDALDGSFQLTCERDPLRVANLVRTEDFHVVLLDLHMPGLSGLEVLRQIREIDEDLAVMIVTAHPSFETAQASIGHRVDAYVPKPIDIEELTGHLHRVAERKGIVFDQPERALKQIGRTIRDLRVQKGLSLRQLSRRSGLSASLISATERATTSASMTSLLRVAAALGVPVRDLFEDV